jgi:small subunit ribosomal protein S17
MADEEKEIQEAAAADAPAEPVAVEAPAPAEADLPAAATETANEAASPEAEEAAESEAVAEAPAAAAPAPAVPKEPEVILTPKERKVATRNRKVAKVPARGQTAPEDRQAERDALRTKKAAERRAGRAHARAKYKSAEHERVATPPREHEAGNQKTRQGVVVSDKADKTITVRIDVARRHRKYQKIVRTSNTVHAHDESNDANIGDTVVVRESRPLSRTKRWRLVQIVERAK